MAPFVYLSALQSWILCKIDSIALFRACRFLAVPWCGVKNFVITSVSGLKLHNPTSSDSKSSRRLEALSATSPGRTTIERSQKYRVLPPKKRTRNSRFLGLLWKESGDSVPRTPWDFSLWACSGRDRTGAGGLARRRPHLPFARLHRRSSCVPAELYPPLQHRDLGLGRFHCQLLV